MLRFLWKLSRLGSSVVITLAVGVAIRFGRGSRLHVADSRDQGRMPRDRSHATSPSADLIELAVGGPSETRRGIAGKLSASRSQ